MATVIDGSASVTINSGAVLGITSGTAVASTSGTSIDFTSIPSWVKRVTVMFSGVSTSGTSSYLVQIGAGSITNTGYKSTSAFGGSGSVTASTTGFLACSNVSAAGLFSGHMVITTIGSNIWVESAIIMADTVSATGTFGSGTVTLSGALDRVRITTVNGTDTFDAGSINIMYEG